MAGLVHEVPTTKRPIFLSFLLPPSFFSSLLFLFFFLDYLHVSCPPMVTQSRSSLNPETSPAFVGRCCIAGRDECDESFENSAKTNLFSFFLREVSLQLWILFFFWKKIGTNGTTSRQKFLSEDSEGRILSSNWNFLWFFLSFETETETVFFFIEFEFTFSKRSYRF